MSTKKPRKNPYLITFNISAEDILGLHYGGVTTTLDGEVASKKENTARSEHSRSDTQYIETELSSPRENNILHEHDKFSRRIHYFFDSKKIKVKVWPVMIDDTHHGIIPLYTNKPCRWCHKSYETHPFGCPIRYNPHVPINITSNVHTSNQVDLRDRVISFLKENNLNSDTNDFFETEQMFCSLPCVKSYILSCLSNNNKSYKYHKSLSYLTLMYKKMYNTQIISSNIPRAHPIEVLRDYGGHLTIQEYRESFGMINYEETPNVRRPYMYSSSDYIEETKVKGY